MAKAVGMVPLAYLLAVSSVYYGQQAGPTGGATPQPRGVCTDSDGGTYSPGALVPIRGQLMRCVIGPHWVPMDPAAASQSSVLDALARSARFSWGVTVGIPLWLLGWKGPIEV